MPEKEPLTFRPAPEVESIATQLIEAYHRHLKSERIIYLFRSENEVVGGKACLGTARKVGGLNALLADESFADFAEPHEPQPFFVIQIFEDGWNALTDLQQIALVDHELCHCGCTEEGKLTMIPHDLEEFVCIVQRHGLWMQDVDKFVREAVKKMQPSMDIANSEQIDASVRVAVEELQKLSDRDGSTLTISHGGQSATIAPRKKAKATR